MEAEGGTLFLDEVDALPLMAQVKLLRLLQQKEYKPLGSTSPRQADIRVIAATNTPIGQALGEGKLRHDLYYRLNVISVNLPPLRNRKIDIFLLAGHFLYKYAQENGKRAACFSQDANEVLFDYDWPGNVRELENVVHKAVVLSEGPVIHARGIELPGGRRGVARQSFREAKRNAVALFERSYVEELLAIHRGNISHAARAAGKHRRAFWELMRKYGVQWNRKNGDK